MRIIITSILILSSLISFGQNSSLEELWKLYRFHNYKLVIEKATPLLNVESNNINFNLLLGRTYADMGDYEDAIPYLNRAIENDNYFSGRKVKVFGYLGTCYFMLQKYDNSKDALKKGINLSVNENESDNLHTMYSLFGFDEFYENWKVIETDSFRFHFQNMSDIEIKKYISLREKAYKLINSFFNSKLPKKIDFFVWESRKDAKNILKSNLGFSKPDFCIVHSYYQQTIGHEMTHIISNYTSDILKKTRFINEGTAVCFDQSNHDRLKEVKDWIKKNHKQIVIKDYWENGEKYNERFYPLSGLFVKELIDNFGKEKFLEFFKNQTYENAKIVFGDKLDIVIQEFENKINT